MTVRYTFIATHSYPPLGIWPGDVLVVEPGIAEPVCLYRSLPPNYRAVLDASELGALLPLSPTISAAALAALIGSGPIPGAPHRPAPPARELDQPQAPRLRRVK